MNKLSEFFKGLIEKFKNFSNKKRIAIISLAVVVLAAVIFLGVYLNSPKYELLFANLDAKDAKKVTDKLTEDKASYHIQGSSIYVQKGSADQLRMEILGSVDFNGGTEGWELFDSTNQFGPSDLENQVKYMRALEGKLETTIKAFPQVNSDIVNLVLSEDSAFVKDSTKASASVFLKLKPNQTLKKTQVKAIVMLISGSVKNLPKENIQVVDDNMNLLSQGLFSSDSSNSDNSDTASSVSDNDNTAEEEQMKKDYEKYCQEKALDMLKLVYGDKVNVKVNVDLNFDAISQQTTTYSPNGTVVSENNTSSTNGAPSSSANTNSPVDNNMVNSGTTTSSSSTGSSTSTNVTKNYEISSDVKKVIYAPGSVKRITAAVIIGGNVDTNTKTAVTNTVQTALGIDTTRGDAVSVEGLPFDTTLQQQQKAALKQMNDEIAQQDKTKQVLIYVGLGVLGAIALGTVIALIIKRRSKKTMEEEEEIFEDEKGKGFDVVVGEDIVPQEIEAAEEEKKSKTNFKPLDLEPEENEQSHIESEVRKYAMNKPEQVADIVKSWLADDER